MAWSLFGCFVTSSAEPPANEASTLMTGDREEVAFQLHRTSAQLTHSHRGARSRTRNSAAVSDRWATARRNHVRVP
jgi:hypothetical protein